MKTKNSVYPLTALLLLCCPAAAAAKILLVPDQHPTIQQAIAAAAPGDTVRAAEGTYSENVSLRPGMTLEGGWDRSFQQRDFAKHATTIDGSARGGFVVFGADKAVLDGFTVTGGKAPFVAPDADVGAGVICAAAAFTVRNCFITGNRTAGIYGHSCTLAASGNIIAANGKAGIFLEQGSTAVIKGNIISHNLRAGIYAGEPDRSKVEISNNAINDNARAGINVTWATGSIANNLIYKNGEAGIRCGAAPLLAVNNTIVENGLAGVSVADSAVPAPAKDGAKTQEQDVPQIRNNIIANNGEAGIRSNGAGCTHNLLYGNNKAEGFYPDFLWYLRLQFGGYEDQGSLEKTKNIVADPLFVDPARHDYRLRPGSPAIDGGDPDPQFNDTNFGPSLGAEINDLGAYGGPGTAAEKRSANLPPAAKIAPVTGPVYVGDKVIINGRESLDPNGDVIRYDWSITSRPPGSRAVPLPQKDGTCEFSPDKAGMYAVRLTATDRWGMQGVPVTTSVTADPDRPPAAKISKPTEPVNVGETVTLSAYDKDQQNGSALSWFWTLLRKPAASRAVLADSMAERPSFLADAPGCYSLQLSVSNGKKSSQPDTAHICTKQSRVPGRRSVPDECPTIQAALDTAEAGEDVVVQPGRYRENIIIDKAVNLIGIGRPVIDGGSPANDSATVFVCYLDNMASGKIQGFSVTGGGAGQYGHGIQILNSSPEIVDNQIWGNKHVGVGIHGLKKFTEKTKIHGNAIYDNAVGISNGLGASGLIYNNTVYNNKAAGIGVRGLATPELRNNTVYGNHIGIGVREEAYPLIEGNTVYDNVLGIAVNPGANTTYAEQSRITVRNNSVRNNRKCGIFISSLNQSGLFIQGNTVTGNSSEEGSRSGGVVSGYPHEALVKLLLATNTVSGNNGRDVEEYKNLADPSRAAAERGRNLEGM